jgi:hypothetical protein
MTDYSEVNPRSACEVAFSVTSRQGERLAGNLPETPRFRYVPPAGGPRRSKLPRTPFHGNSCGASVQTAFHPRSIYQTVISCLATIQAELED